MMLWVVFAIMTFVVVALLLRPLLRAKASAENTTARRISAMVIVVLLPTAALLLYSYLGSPRLPGQPYADRVKNDPDFAIAAGAEQLSEKLKDRPDADGFMHLGDAMFMLRRYPEAASAYDNAIKLGNDTDEVWSGFGESLVMASNGDVVPDAVDAFTNALKRDNGDAKARFYIGLAKAQANNSREAVAIWRDLIKDAPAGASWVDMVKDNIAKYSKDGAAK